MATIQQIVDKAIAGLNLNVISNQHVSCDGTDIFTIVIRQPSQCLEKNQTQGKRVHVDATKRKENLNVSVGVRFTKNEDLLTRNIESVTAKLKSQNKIILGFAFFHKESCLSIRKLYDGKVVPTNNVYEYVKTIKTAYKLGCSNNFGAESTIKVIYN